MTPPGRPEIGQPINIRLGDDLLAEVDEYATELGVSRAEAIRQLVRVAMIDKLVARNEQHRLEKIVHEGRLAYPNPKWKMTAPGSFTLPDD